MLLQRPGIVVAIDITVLGASIVASPDVIASLRELADQGRTHRVETQPVVRCLTGTMHHQNGWLGRVFGEGLAFDRRDSEDCESPAVLSLHDMRLPLVAKSVAYIGPSLVFGPDFF